MTEIAVLLSALHRSFSDAISVRTVPSGLAVNSPFYDSSGDHLAFFARDTNDGIVLEDDGSFLPHLLASGIDIETGQRRQLLDTMLSESGAYWDTKTYEVRTRAIPPGTIGPASVRFLSGLLRIRTLEEMTRETVRSTFKEDATDAIKSSLADMFEIEERAGLSADLADFPADIVLTPKTPNLRKLGLFLVNTSTQFLEAELLQTEIEKQHREKSMGAIALIEDFAKISLIGERRYQRAVNHGLATRFFRDYEQEVMTSVRKLAA